MIAAGVMTVAGLSVSPVMAADVGDQYPRVQQIRNATMKITYGSNTFLIDPMLSRKGAFPGFDGTVNNDKRNPLIELPVSTDDVISGVSAVIVTHTHLDHWDEAAQKLLPKNLPIFVQNKSDASILEGQGFTNVTVLEKSVKFNGVTLTRTGGQHGTDEMYSSPEVAKGLGKAMGVVFEAPKEKTTYLAGDTIWCSDVDRAIENYRPGVIILNTGDAKLQAYPGAIIMGKEDVLRAVKKSPGSIIVATHMDAINHTMLSREELGEYVKKQKIADRVRIPADGANVDF